MRRNLVAVALVACAAAFAAYAAGPTATQQNIINQYGAEAAALDTQAAAITSQARAIRDSTTALVASFNPPVTPPAPAVSATCRDMVSVDLLNTGNALATFQNTAMGGRKVDCIWFSFGASSWSAQLGDITGNLATNALLQAARAQGSNGYWTVPILVTGASWANAANGAYDGYWRAALTPIAAYVPSGSPIYLRPAAEFSGTWFPWSVAPGQEADFVKAWKRYVAIARSISPNFKFEWSPALLFGNTQNTPQAGVVDLIAAYPGDTYVDLIGVDPYYRVLGPNGLIPDIGWTAMLNAWASWQPSMTWANTFALAHHKQLVFTEWGVDDNSESVNVTRQVAYIKSTGAWQSYFNRSATGDILARIDDGTKPAALAAYQVGVFGQ